MSILFENKSVFVIKLQIPTFFEGMAPQYQRNVLKNHAGVSDLDAEWSKYTLYRSIDSYASEDDSGNFNVMEPVMDKEE